MMSDADPKETLLVVDDSADTLEMLQRKLSAEGYNVLAAPDVQEALRLLESHPVALVITDLKMPRVSGLDLVRHIRENLRDTEVMMVTGYATVEGAVEAVKMGAEEYLAKPFTDEELFGAVRRALDKVRLRRASRAREPGALPRHGFLGETDAARKVLDAIRKAAQSSATVLVTGESGTGKELVARAIHYGSARASAPFLAVNCAGIPEGLLESELFGYMKGAFTGALESRAGFFQAADGGTIFLDEISDTSPSMQAKLLRVLQDKEVVMLGSTRPRRVDVRIIAATNKNLEEMVRKGAFREDLFFRINVIRIDVPPLRDRRDDIPMLVNHFAARFAAEAGRPVPRFSDKAMEILRNYRWPGNVRELENVVNRIVVMADEEVIDVPDLPVLMRFSALSETPEMRPLAEVEAEYIRNVLRAVGGNVSRAAAILRIDRKTLRRKLGKA